jgi:hypothetical protein
VWFWFLQPDEHEQLILPYSCLNPITRETRDYNIVDDIWDTIKDVVNAHDPKRTLGQELYYLLPLFANPKYILDEHHFSLINEYHYVKDYNIKLDYFTIIKNELASVIRHKQEKDGRSKS